MPSASSTICVGTGLADHQPPTTASRLLGPKALLRPKLTRACNLDVPLPRTAVLAPKTYRRRKRLDVGPLWKRGGTWRTGTAWKRWRKDVARTGFGKQRAENNLKTTGDEEMESKEEDEGGTSPVANNNESSKEETLGMLEKVKARGSGGQGHKGGDRRGRGHGGQGRGGKGQSVANNTDIRGYETLGMLERARGRGGRGRGGRGCSVAKNSDTSNEETLGMLEQKKKK